MKSKIMLRILYSALLLAEFFREYKKLTGDDASPLFLEDLERAIREIPRDPEVIELFKKLASGGALPAR